MVHKLAFVAIIGLTTSAVCLGAAAAIAGRQFINDFDLSGLSNDDRPRCENGGGYPISRTLDWDGSDHADIAIPGRATYTPGNDGKLHVSGNPVLVPHIRVRDGRIELDCRISGDTRDLAITLPGREFKKFAIAGSADLELHNLSQDMLKVSIAGSGDIKGNGKVDHVQIHIAGSGDTDLGHVAMQTLEVKIAGSGDADGAPSEEADVSIAGSGDVTLHSNPKRLDQHVAGSGSVRVVGSGT